MSLDRSMILLAPAGDEYSTVSEAVADALIATAFAVTIDPVRACHWMFNSKTITVRTVITGGPGAMDETLTFYHSGDPGLVLLGDTDPLPFNYFDGDTLSCPAMNADSQNQRWVDGSGNSSDQFFYVFIKEGVWYWTPGVFGLDSESVGSISDTSFVRSGDSGGYPCTITTTITDTFY